MMYVLFVIISLGNNNHTIFYERNLSQDECYAMVEAFEQSNEYKASCQVMNPEI